MLHLELRAESSSKMRVIAPILAIVFTLICGLLLFAALGKNPFVGFKVFFLFPIKDLDAITELLLKATPLMLIATGLSIGFRANIWNIGAEGQFVFGAIFATGVALFLPENSIIMLPAMLIAGTLGGMFWAAIPAILRNYFNANEILVSLMLVYVAQFVASWLVFGPWKDPEGFNFPQSKMFSDAAILPILISGTRLNAAFPVAIGFLLLAYLLMFRSFLGFKMQVSGLAPAAARYAGFSKKTMVWIGLLAGGGMAGIAGMAEVAGPVGQLTEHVSAGYGFAAIIVAFIGRLHPIGIFFGSLLMALLFIGGEQAQQYLGLPSSIAKVFQGMLLFFLLGSDLFINYQLKWR